MDEGEGGRPPVCAGIPHGKEVKAPGFPQVREAVAPMKEQVIACLAERGVRLSDVAHLVLQFWEPKVPDLTLAECEESVEHVIAKRETQYALLTGIALDALAERGLLPQPLQDAVASDEPLFGVDEVLALAVTNLYGSVGLLGFGYLDKLKPGILGRLNRAKGGQVHTFLDDLIAAIAAAAGARIAHQRLGGPA